MSRADFRTILGRIFRFFLWGGLIVFLYFTTFGWRSTQSSSSVSVISYQKESTARAVKEHVHALSEQIGLRSMAQYDNLQRAAAYIADDFEKNGLAVQSQEYEVDGKMVRNIIAQKKGEHLAGKVLIIAAHYDSYYNPGADNNASGIAALLELAHVLSLENTGMTIRYVAFVNKEPPFYGTDKMGSAVFIESLKASGDDVAGVIILDSIGYYSTGLKSQRYPPLLGLVYPPKANFVALVSNSKSMDFARSVESLLRVKMPIPLEFFVGFDFIDSDHVLFWKNNYPAVLLTDTGSYRNPDYYSLFDTYPSVHYQNIVQMIEGLAQTIQALAN